MMKFFRKYNKHLLAVFMVLLMVVFLGGSALQSLWTPAVDRVVAHSAVGDISFFDQQQAAASTSILRALGIDWRQPYGPVGEPLTELDWILLTREAEQFGTQADAAAARTWLGSDLGPAQIDMIARRLSIKPTRIYAAVADLRSVQSTAWVVSNAAIPSAAEIRKAARDALDKIKLSAVVLPAEAFVNNDIEFTEEELAAQLEAHREKEPGTGLNFGYYVAPEIQVQYVQVSREKIAEVIGVPNLEGKARKFYTENLTDPMFARPPEPQPAEDEPEVVGPQPEKPPYLNWEEAKEIAVDVIKKQQAEEAAKRIVGWIADYTAEPWLEAERGEDRYKIPPAEVARDDYYDKVIKRVPASIRYPEAVLTGKTGFFNEAEAFDVPLLGNARTQNPGLGMSQSLQTLAFKTKAIVPEIPKADGVNMAEYLATWQPCPYPLADPDGNVYVFRVVDGKPGHPAESVDEVRDRLVKDLRLMRAYDAANSLAEVLMMDAYEKGLLEAFDSDEQLQAAKDLTDDSTFGFFTPSAFSRVQRYEAARGRQKGWTYVPDLGKLSDDAIDRCFALADAPDKFTLLELEDRATIMVVECIELLPGREDEFGEMKKTLVTQLTGNRRRDTARDWLDPEQVRARNGFAWATADE